MRTSAHLEDYSRAGDRVRTGDIQLGRLTLYQLSYSRFFNPEIIRILVSICQFCRITSLKNACKDSDKTLSFKKFEAIFHYGSCFQIVNLQKRTFHVSFLKIIVGRAGFEPAKVKTNRFTVCPRWPLEYLPQCFFTIYCKELLLF